MGYRVMVKACVRTIGNYGKEIIDRVSGSKYEIVYASDKNTCILHEKYKEIEVLSLIESVNLYKDGKISKFLISSRFDIRVLFSMREELIGLGVEDEDILFVPIDVLENKSLDFAAVPFMRLKYLWNVEFHLVNKCNLNCAGCCHFSPLFSPQDEIDYKDLELDLINLRKNVNHIGILRIMGGEPLLSDNIIECCYKVRELYPYSDIEIVTNGLILNKVSDELLETMKNTDIGFNISCYPQMQKYLKEIEQRLLANGVRFTLDTRFKMGYVLRREDDTEHKFPFNTTYNSCTCLNLYKGRLYSCPVEAYISHYNDYFNTNYPVDENAGTDLTIVNDFHYLWIKLHKPKKLCDLCSKWEWDYNAEWNDFVSFNPQIGSKYWVKE